jgi:hypothetical protein
LKYLAYVAGLDYDALALLVVRLRSDRPSEGELCWHAWDAASGAEPHGLPEDAARRSTWDEPFKRLPGEGSWPYFNAHVERLLFPPGNERGARWLCCPGQLYLELAKEDGGPRRQTRVDLLERLTTPLDSGSTIGLIHLSLLPTTEPDAPDTLWWNRAITSTFSRDEELPEFVLRQEGRRADLAVRRPVRALVEELFGDPDPHLERSLYTVTMAGHPPDRRNPDELGDWRRALAGRRLTTKPPYQSEREMQREERQTVRIAGTVGLVLGQSAAFTLPGSVTGSYARNLRSYWAESIVLGLMQQDCLEEFQRRLADMGDPLNPSVERLNRDWLKFRNMLWWSQLSSGSEFPQELVSRLRAELGTERLFTDLEGDLATYSQQQHQVAEGEQATALANLQIYGSGIVVLGPLTTVIGLVGANGCLLATLIVASFLVAVGVSVFVHRQLKGGTSNEHRDG